MANVQHLACNAFPWADGDHAAIAQALTHGSAAWSRDEVADLKRRIRSHHMRIQQDQCCYCRRSLYNEFNYVIDVEHILPKNRFPNLAFDMVNLSVACKRCNMNIKRTKVDFVSDPTLILLNHRFNTLYSFIHPNLDTYDDHLVRLECAVGSRRIVKYVVHGQSSKGLFTYVYFRLHEFEISSFDRIQADALPLPGAGEEDRRLELASALNTLAAAIGATGIVP